MPKLLLSHPLLQLPRLLPQTRVTQPQTHTRGKSQNPRTLYFQFELRKASSEQELLTPCASPPRRAGSGRQVLLTGDAPESTQRHQARPQQHQECPRHSPGLAVPMPSSPCPGPSPSSAGLPAAALRSRCLPDPGCCCPWKPSRCSSAASAVQTVPFHPGIQGLLFS